MDSLVNRLQGRLLFAVPKKGRLNGKVLDLIEGADIQFSREHRHDIAFVKNHQIALIFLPAADIPYVVDQGNVAIGITGKDQVLEYEATKSFELGHELADSEKVEEVLDLQFGGCKLQVQVPESSIGITSAKDLVHKRIATSFKGLTQQYFRRLEAGINDTKDINPPDRVKGLNSIKTHVEHLNGSVETACTISGVDGIVDLVESGDTMRAAGLKAIATVVTSTAVLIESKHPKNKELLDMIISRISGVIAAKSYLLTIYNIPRRLLDQAKTITPGKRAPTVTPLLDDSGAPVSQKDPSIAEEWVAISSMVETKRIADVMDKLKVLGATDILCMKIENSRAA